MNRQSGLAIAVFILGSFVVFAARTSAAGIMGMESGDLRISTDSTDYDIGTGEFSMPQHVAASRPGTQIDGDRAHGNGKDKLVVLEGHVVVHHSGGATDDSPLGGSGGANSEPSTLTTDKLTIALGPKEYTADGHVHFTQGSRTAISEHAVLNDLTHDLHLTGNVHLEDKGQTLEAQSLDYNTDTEHVKANTDVRIIVPLATPAPLPAVVGSPVPGAKRRHPK